MYREIDLSEWTLFSSRWNSKNYYNKDKTQHLKLITKAAPNSAEMEYKKAKLVYDSGISTPNALEIVSYGDERGVIFEYIKDKKSLLRASMEDREHLEEYMTRWGVALRKFHSTPCDTDFLSNYQGEIENALRESKLCSKRQKEFLLDALTKIPVIPNYIMIDANPSNFIFDGKKEYIIDLSDLAYGNGGLDLGFWCSLLFGQPMIMSSIAAKTLKSDLNLFRAGWPMFLKAYLGTTDEEIIRKKDEEIRIMGALDMVMIMNSVRLPSIFNFIKRICFNLNFKKLVGKI